MPDKDPLDRIDELMLEIAEDQAAILKLVAKAMAAHQEVDKQYAPQLNPLYRSAWSKFQELERLAEPHKPELMARGKKSSRRNTGTIGWRSNSQLVLHVETDEIVRRIKALGQTLSRRFLRRRVTWDLRTSALKAQENRETVNGIDGLEVVEGDMLYIDPNNGLYMSSANPWWPSLEGVTTTRALATLFKDPDQ